MPFSRLDRARAREILALAERDVDQLLSVADEVSPALESLIESDRASALRLVGLLVPFWEGTGRVDEGRGLTDRALDGQHRAATLDRDVAAAIPGALLAASELAFRQGDQEEAQRQARAAIRAAVLVEDYATAALAEINLSRVAFREGNAPEIERHAHKALDYGAKSGDDPGARRGALHMLAWAAHTAGNLDEAERRFRESLEFRREIGASRVSIASELSNLGDLALERGDVRGAGRYLAEALEMVRETQSTYMLVNQLPSFGAYAVKAGRHAEGVRMFGAADAVAAAAGMVPDPGGEHSEARDAARDQLGPAEFARLLAEGTRLSTDEAVELARGLVRETD